jgi:hypothetical protein
MVALFKKPLYEKYVKRHNIIQIVVIFAVTFLLENGDTF